jgi:hypothetical protein
VTWHNMDDPVEETVDVAGRKPQLGGQRYVVVSTMN